MGSAAARRCSLHCCGLGYCYSNYLLLARASCSQGVVLGLPWIRAADRRRIRSRNQSVLSRCAGATITDEYTGDPAFAGRRANTVSVARGSSRSGGSTTHRSERSAFRTAICGKFVAPLDRDQRSPVESRSPAGFTFLRDLQDSLGTKSLRRIPFDVRSIRSTTYFAMLNDPRTIDLSAS